MERLVKETILLDKCSVGDAIYIPYPRYPNSGPTHVYGSFIIMKFKPLPKRQIQLKLKSTHSYGYGLIRKVTLDVGTRVERTRPWTESDGENAGFYKPEIVVINGIQYSVRNPEQLETLLDRIEKEKQEEHEHVRRLLFDQQLPSESLLSALGLSSLFPKRTGIF